MSKKDKGTASEVLLKALKKKGKEYDEPTACFVIDEKGNVSAALPKNPSLIQKILIPAILEAVKMSSIAKTMADLAKEEGFLKVVARDMSQGPEDLLSDADTEDTEAPKKKKPPIQ